MLDHAVRGVFYGGVEGVAHGGLMAYGLQHERMFTAAGEMIDRVLRDGGAKSVKELIGIREPTREELALVVVEVAVAGE